MTQTLVRPEALEVQRRSRHPRELRDDGDQSRMICVIDAEGKPCYIKGVIPGNRWIQSNRGPRD